MDELAVGRLVDAAKTHIEQRYPSAENVTWEPSAGGFAFTILKPERPFWMWVERSFFTDRQYHPDDIRTKLAETRVFGYIDRCKRNERVLLLADGEIRVETIA